MSAKHSTTLTKTQHMWFEHIQRAKAARQPFSEYAKQHSLNLKAFYNYHTILRQKGALANPANKVSTLIKIAKTVSHARSPGALTVIFPNGIRVEIVEDHRDLSEILEQVRSL